MESVYCDVKLLSSSDIAGHLALPSGLVIQAFRLQEFGGDKKAKCADGRWELQRRPSCLASLRGEEAVTRLKQARYFSALLALVIFLIAGSFESLGAQQGGLDFRLPPADDNRDSNVQGPADNGLPPVSRPTPQPAPKSSTPKIIAPPIIAPQVGQQPQPQQKSIAAPKAVAPVVAPKAAPPASAPQVSAPTASSELPNRENSEEPAAVSQEAVEKQSSSPVASEALDEGMPIFDPITDDQEDVAGPSVDGEEEAPWWAWPLAVLIAVLAGYIYWKRQNKAVSAGLDEKEAAGAAPVPVRREPAPNAPKATAPVAPPKAARPAQPDGAQRPQVAPLPAHQPSAPAPEAASEFVTARPPVRRAADENRADVQMDVAVRSIRIEADHVAVGFLLTLSNLGAMDATGLMVRIALGQGSSMNEAVLGRFYDGAGGSVLRDDIDLPAGRSEQLSSEVKLPRQLIDPLMMSGRPMLVPVLAADVTYHWDGLGEAFGQIAAAYVLGRSSVGGSAKLAPIPLDSIPLALDRPAARATAITRRQ